LASPQRGSTLLEKTMRNPSKTKRAIVTPLYYGIQFVCWVAIGIIVVVMIIAMIIGGPRLD